MKTTTWLLLCGIIAAITGYAAFDYGYTKMMKEYQDDVAGWHNAEQHYLGVITNHDSVHDAKIEMQKQMIIDLYEGLTKAVYANHPEEINAYFKANICHNVDSVIRAKFPNIKGLVVNYDVNTGKVSFQFTKGQYSDQYIWAYVQSMWKDIVYLDAQKMLNQVKPKK